VVDNFVLPTILGIIFTPLCIIVTYGASYDSLVCSELFDAEFFQSYRILLDTLFYLPGITVTNL
jgi:hypothetical protein